LNDKGLVAGFGPVVDSGFRRWIASVRPGRDARFRPDRTPQAI